MNKSNLIIILYLCNLGDLVSERKKTLSTWKSSIVTDITRETVNGKDRYRKPQTTYRDESSARVFAAILLTNTLVNK